MDPSQDERERLLQALELLEREQRTLNPRDDSALRAMNEKLEALRERIRAYRMRRDADRQ